MQLRVCNEEAPAGCTLSGVQNVQTYGRLDGMLDDIGPPCRQRQDDRRGPSPAPATATRQRRRGPDQRRADRGRSSPRRSGALQPSSSTFTTDELRRRTSRIVGAAVRRRTRAAVARTGRPHGPQRRPTATDDRDRRGEPRARRRRRARRTTAASGPPDTPCDVPSCAFVELSITFAPDAQQAIWRCEFDKFRVRARRTSGSGDFNGQVRPYYQSGETVAGTCRRSSGNYARPALRLRRSR